MDPVNGWICLPNCLLKLKLQWPPLGQSVAEPGHFSFILSDRLPWSCRQRAGCQELQARLQLLWELLWRLGPPFKVFPLHLSLSQRSHVRNIIWLLELPHHLNFG